MSSTAARMPRSESVRPRRPVVVTCPRARRERGQRPAAHEGIAAPALAALDGLEEEAVCLPHDVGEAGDRRQGVSHHFAPDRHDGVRLGQRGELGGVGVEDQGARRPLEARTAAGGHGAGTPGPFPTVRKKQERSPV